MTTLEDLEFTDCSECVHSESEDGCNREYLGSCKNCIHNPEYTDWFINKHKEDK